VAAQPPRAQNVRFGKQPRATAAYRLSLQIALKMIKINRIIRFAVRHGGSPTVVGPRRYALRVVGTPNLATTLHNRMCPYSVSFLLVTYLAKYKLLLRL
jgi:hypothetical protein